MADFFAIGQVIDLASPVHAMLAPRVASFQDARLVVALRGLSVDPASR